jgi:hypothetical protein
MAAFFQRQEGPFAVQSVDLTAKGLRVRFPLRGNDIGLGTDPAPIQGDPAALRVADLRRSRSAEQANLVRIDGTAAGSLETSDDANPSGYRSMPAGTYVVVTNRVGGGDPVIRQVVTLHPGVTYTLALFSAAESGQVAVQLAPDGPPTGTMSDSAVRMLHAASAAGSVYVALVAPGMVEPMVLANQAGYGLITGYAAVPAGQYEVVVTANGREWRQPVEFLGGEPMSLLLTDGTDGPVVRTLRDVADAPAALNPPTLTIPASGKALGKTQITPPATDQSGGKRIAVVLCIVAIMGAGVLIARARPRRSIRQNDAALQEAVRAHRRAVDVVQPAPTINTDAERSEPDVDNTTRLPGQAVIQSVGHRRPRRPNDGSLHHAVRACWHEVVHCARPVDDTARLNLSADNTARLDLITVPVKRSVPSLPREQNGVALHQAVRAHWREAARRARPADDTARLTPGVDETARLPAGAITRQVPREPR